MAKSSIYFSTFTPCPAFSNVLFPLRASCALKLFAFLLLALCVSNTQAWATTPPEEVTTTSTKTITGTNASTDGTVTTVTTRNNVTGTVTMVSTDVLAAGGTQTTNEVTTNNPDGSVSTTVTITLPNGQTETNKKTTSVAANGTTTITGANTGTNGQTLTYVETITPIAGGTSTTETETNASGQKETIQRTTVKNASGVTTVTGSTTLFTGQVEQYSQTVTPTANGGSTTVTTITNAQGQKQITQTIVTKNGTTTTTSTSGTNFNGTPLTPTTTSTDTTSTSTAQTTNGKCGSANGQTLMAAPSTNLCSAGTASAVAGTGPWNWNCAGIDLGTTAQCSAALAKPTFTINSITANPTSVAAGKTVTLALSITPSMTVSGYPVEFSYSAPGVANANQVFFPNFVAGQAVTVTYQATIPASATAGSGSFTAAIYNPQWSVPALAETTTHFTVTTAINGKVGSDEGQTFSTLSSTDPNLCSTGTVSNFVATSSGWTWACAGSNGGTTDTSGSAILHVTMTINSVTVNPTTVISGKTVTLTATITPSSTVSGYPVEFSYSAPGTANTNQVFFPNFVAGQAVTVTYQATIPASATAGSGSFTAAVYNPQWSVPALAATTTHFTVTDAINGKVGSDEGQTFSTLSSTDPNLCSTGTVSNFVATSTGWTWSCLGSNGGTTDTSGSAILHVTMTINSVTVNPTTVISGKTVTLTATITPSSTVSGYPVEFSYSAPGVANANQVFFPNFVAGQTATVTYQATIPASATAGSGSFMVAVYNPQWSVPALAQTTTHFTVTVVVNGQAGSAKGGDFATLSSTSANLCSAGTVSNFAASSTGWTWSCLGSNGGTNDTSGSAFLIINGACGSANGVAVSSAPTSNLCTTGTASSVSGNGPFTWTCSGINTGTNASCSAASTKPTFTINSITVNPTTVVAGKTVTLAVSITPSSTVSGYPVEFSYSAPGVANANQGFFPNFVAGQAVTVTYQATIPTSATDGSGSFTVAVYNPQWSVPALAATTTHFTVSGVVNGQAGSAKGGDFATLSSTSANLCSAGTVINFAATTSGWSWGCQGAGGGTTDNSGMALLIINGACGAANGVTTNTAPTSGLCSAGNASAVSGSGPYSWSCAGINTGTTASCSAPLITTINGKVGSDEGKSFSTLSNTDLNLCSAGTVSNFTTTTSGWTWACAGSNGGTTDTSGKAYLVTAEKPGPSAALFANPFYGCLRNFYVSTTGDDKNEGTTPSTAWLTIQNADTSARVAGDCINVEPGVYAEGATISYGGDYASPTGYVVYRCLALDACKITESDKGFSLGNASGSWANYVVIDGFEVAAAQEQTYGVGIGGWDGGNNNPANNGQGEITFGSHHFWILNNIVHGYGQAGIGVNDGDYFYTIHNSVYNNANVTCDAQGSGITYVVEKPLLNYTPTAMDLQYAPFHQVVEWNVVYNNILTQCGTASNPYDTDGNGIIMDTFDNQGLPNTIVYPYQSLVAFNIAYNNGGGGVHIFRSSYVTVANNTAYNNDLDPFNVGTGRADIDISGGQGNTFINNIAIANPATSLSDPRCKGVNYAVSPWNVPSAGAPNGCPLEWNGSFLGGSAAGETDVNNTWSNNVNLGGTPLYGGQNAPANSGNELWGNDTMSCSFVWSPGASSGNQCNNYASTLVVNAAAANFALSAGSTGIGFGLQESYLPATSIDVGACSSTLSQCP